MRYILTGGGAIKLESVKGSNLSSELDWSLRTVFILLRTVQAATDILGKEDTLLLVFVIMMPLKRQSWAKNDLKWLK